MRTKKIADFVIATQSHNIEVLKTAVYLGEIPRVVRGPSRSG